MATRKAVKKSSAKKAKSARKPAARRNGRPKAASAPAPSKIREGIITHTEFASSDPAATQSWFEKVLRWKFEAPSMGPTGLYHMWRFPNGTGGGIRTLMPPEAPGSIPYCEVKDIHATYSRALGAGAVAMMAPEQLPGGMGWIAIVAAPGGCAIGFWGTK